MTAAMPRSTMGFRSPQAPPPVFGTPGGTCLLVESPIGVVSTPPVGPFIIPAAACSLVAPARIVPAASCTLVVNGRNGSCTPPVAVAARHGAPATRSNRLNRVFSEMRDVERVMLGMEQDTGAMKSRLLHTKQRGLEKYFMADAHLAKQAVFGTWHTWALRERNFRNIDGSQQRCLSDEQVYAEQVQEMDFVVGQLREELNEALREQQRVLTLERTELSAAAACCEQLEAMVVQMGGVSSRVTEIARQVRGNTPFELAGDDHNAMSNSIPGAGASRQPQGVSSQGGQQMVNDPGASGFAKGRLHALLEEIDPRYLGPLHDSTLQEVMVAQLTRRDPFERQLRSQFERADVNGDGVLEWNNGEIRQFIVSALMAASHEVPVWNDWEWYTMYRTFDPDGTHRMDFGACQALAHEIRARVLAAARAG